jgi:hypothetical protein
MELYGIVFGLQSTDDDRTIVAGNDERRTSIFIQNWRG